MICLFHKETACDHCGEHVERGWLPWALPFSSLLCSPLPPSHLSMNPTPFNLQSPAMDLCPGHPCVLSPCRRPELRPRGSRPPWVTDSTVVARWRVSNHGRTSNSLKPHICWLRGVKAREQIFLEMPLGSSCPAQGESCLSQEVCSPPRARQTGPCLPSTCCNNFIAPL